MIELYWNEVSSGIEGVGRALKCLKNLKTLSLNLDRNALNDQV